VKRTKFLHTALGPVRYENGSTFLSANEPMGYSVRTPLDAGTARYLGGSEGVAHERLRAVADEWAGGRKSESTARETVLWFETTVEIWAGTEAEEADNLPVQFVHGTKSPRRKIVQFQLPESRVLSDASDRIAWARAKGLSDQSG
jgi:hypothetical protein